MRIRPASKYSSLSLRRLKVLASEGKITAGKNTDDTRGGMIFDRLSLDAYRESQMAVNTDVKKTVDALFEKHGIDVRDLI